MNITGTKLSGATSMAKAAVAREKLFALRETIAKLEGKPVPALAAADMQALANGGLQTRQRRENTRRLSFGISDLDEALEGGLPLDGLTEIRTHMLRDGSSSSGFALALAALVQRQDEEENRACLPVLWIADRVSSIEAGVPYAVGLKDFGLRPELFLHASPRKLEDALWLAEAAVESGVFPATILEVRGNPKPFGLTESRRLSLRAKASGRPLFLLRQAGEEEASSAFFRFLADPAPAQARLLPDGSMLGGSIGNPVFRLTLEKSRNPAPISLLLEWNPHDRRFLPVHQPVDARLPGERTAYSGDPLPASSNGPDRQKAMGALLAFDRAS
jgi:protein ImuA